MTYNLKWTRPSTDGFPKVWLRFKAKDLENNNLVEYRIQDLPVDRFEDAIQHMTENYLHDEPVAQSVDAVNKRPEFVADYQRIWRAVMPQRMALACFKEGSDEIVGLDVSFVCHKDDNFLDQAFANVSMRCGWSGPLVNGGFPSEQR